MTKALLIERLHDAKYGYNDIHGTVTFVPELLKFYSGIFDVAFGACADHALDDDGMGLVAHFEDIVARDEIETGPCRLEVVNRLPHVTFRCEYEGCKAIVVVLNLQLHVKGKQKHYGACSLTFSSAQISNNR